jgi:putative peptidoglycan lipid II flippase
MIKEMLAAKFFGIARSMDAFNSAITVPNYIYAIVITMATFAFMPAFIKIKQGEGREAANELAAVLLNYLFIALALCFIVMFAFRGWIASTGFMGFDAGTSRLTADLLAVLSVTTLLSGMIILLTTILNSYEQFFWPSFSQVFVTLGTMFFIVFFSKNLGVFVFAWGLLSGLAAQLVILIVCAAKYGMRYSFRLKTNHPEAGRIFRISFTLLLIALVAGLNPFINRAMASWLPEGSIAALSYAEKLVLIPMTLISASLITAIFPFFSMQAAENKIDDMKNTFATSVKMSGFIYIPIAATMIVLAKPLVVVLFQRGAFDSRATDLTSTILVFLSIQLFFLYAVAIMQRMIFVFQNTWVIFFVVLLGIIQNVILNYIFIKTVNPPAAGIALSASAGSFISAVVYFMILKKMLSNVHGLSIARSLLSFLLLSAAAAITAHFAYRVLSGIPVHFFVGRLALIAAATAAGIAVYLALAFALRIEEIEKMYNIAKVKIREYTHNFAHTG